MKKYRNVEIYLFNDVLLIYNLFINSYIYLYIYLSIYLYICLSIYLFIHLFMHLFIYTQVILSPPYEPTCWPLLCLTLSIARKWGIGGGGRGRRRDQDGEKVREHGYGNEIKKGKGDRLPWREGKSRSGDAGGSTRGMDCIQSDDKATKEESQTPRGETERDYICSGETASASHRSVQFIDTYFIQSPTHQRRRCIWCYLKNKNNKTATKKGLKKTGLNSKLIIVGG